jgi:hypothetical protein
MSHTVHPNSGYYPGVTFTEPQSYLPPDRHTLYGTRVQSPSYQKVFNGPSYKARSDIDDNESEIKKVTYARAQPGQDIWGTKCTILYGPIRIEYSNGNNKELTEDDQTWLYPNKTLYDYSAKVRIFQERGRL